MATSTDPLSVTPYPGQTVNSGSLANPGIINNPNNLANPTNPTTLTGSPDLRSNQGGNQITQPNPGGQGSPLPGPTPPAGVGLINSIPQPKAPDPYTAATGTATQATATGYTPNGFNVTPNQTVQGQVNDIIDKNSPLMQQAQTRALQMAQSRGLINSSLAVGAGQSAVLDAALPIAQQDANRYSVANDATVNAQNAEKNFEAQATNTASQANAQLGTTASLQNANNATKALSDAFQVNANYGLAGLDANTKAILANLDTSTKIALTTMDQQNHQLLQVNQDASSAFSQAAQAIAQISQNDTLSPQAKNDAIALQMNSLNELLKQQSAVAATEVQAVGSLNLSQYFNTGNTTGNLTAGSNAGTNGSIPTGGSRDAQGNVFNADGTPAGWQGPKDMPTGPGQGGAETAQTGADPQLMSQYGITPGPGGGYQVINQQTGEPSTFNTVADAVAAAKQMNGG